MPHRSQFQYCYAPMSSIAFSLVIVISVALARASASANSSLIVPISLSDKHNLTKPFNANEVPSIKFTKPVLFAAGTGAGSDVAASLVAMAPATAGHSHNVLKLADNLDVRLKNIRNAELGVTIVQEIFDALDFPSQSQSDEEYITKIARRMSKKLDKGIAAINDLRNFILVNLTAMAAASPDTDLDDDDDVDSDDSFYAETPSEKTLYLNTVIQPCPFDDFTLEPNYNKQEIQILNYLKNNGHYDGGDNELTFSVNAKLAEKVRLLNGKANNFKHLFFLSRSDHASDHTCQYYYNDVQFRQLFLSAIKRKHVFLLIDHGEALDAEQLDLSKTFAANVINMLSPGDTVTIVTIADIAKKMVLSPEVPAHAYEATFERKSQILQFIENLNFSERATNHSKGFEYAFDLLREQNVSSDTTAVVFLYITRGLISRLTESMIVLRTIAKGQRLLRAPVVINTCAVILDEKRIMYERQFLRDVAQQNYSKFEIDVSDWLDSGRYNLTGNSVIITKRHPERIIKTSTAVFEGLFNKRFVSEEIEFHSPVFDFSSRETVISITAALEKFGVIGINVFLSDIAEDVIYYKKTDDSYAFLIDVAGFVIYHPAFSHSADSNSDKPSNPVHIKYLENKLRRDNVTRILQERSGNMTVLLDVDNKTLSYTWKRVSLHYIACIATTLKGNGKPAVQQIRNAAPLKRLHSPEDMVPLELLYHRIDLVPPQTPVCRHFRQIATLDTGTLYLGPSAFESPFAFLKNIRENQEEVTTHNAQSIMAYLKDGTNLLANPGLQSQIRDDVNALYHIMTYLKKRQQQSGPLKKYVIRRYAATVNGVLQVYPGCIIGAELEVSRRPWFRKAIRHPGKIVVTEPYLDAGGAGYIISIAHTVFEGKANALHNAERDQPAAIVALDVPYAFFYKLILESSPLCSEPNIKCFLIEDEGYLIAHPSMLEPAAGGRNSRRPLEHLTHKESFVANDILNHKTLVRKRACANYQNQTLQRFYSFNTSLAEVLTNVVHGERTKYQITAIRGTNIFAAILNSTCDGGAFCPCSTVDRVCLNCNRMDQTDCECPCECPLVTPAQSPAVSYCRLQEEDSAVASALRYNWNIGLKSCLHVNCDVHVSQLDCLGVMGCEWCQLDVDNSPFDTPFCTTQNSCFNGVLGSLTPYGSPDIGAAIMEADTPPVYSAIGPVGGAIIALCLVVGFAMYCYRQNLDGASEQIYCNSLPEDNYGVPLSRFNFDDITATHDDCPNGGPPANNIPSNLIAVPDISPYHMSSGGGGYRRPPNGESDHGYSTMTPHEDSEHMCFTLAEPLIKSKRLSMSDSISMNTSVSSPTNHNHGLQLDGEKGGKYSSYPMPAGLGQTLLPSCVPRSLEMSPHHILAPVTVHRHMEAS